MEFAASLLVLFFCVVLLVLLSIFMSKVNAVEARLRWLEHELSRLRSTLAGTAVPPAPPAKRSEAAPVPSAPRPAMPLRAVPRRQPSKFRGEWEAFVGGKLMNRIGALALVIGVGFFLKYAFDNDWITEKLRVALGGAAGVVLLLLGARFHRKGMGVFAQGLLGAGLAVLYLSIYASFNYYHLVSQLAAILLMSAVTAVALSGAIRYDALAISILGWAGGYLTPFMLSTGVANEAGLFSYIGLLEGGLLGVTLVRHRWYMLEFLTLAGSYTVFSIWYFVDYQEEALVITALFLTLFWMLFYLADILRVVVGAEPHLIHRITRGANAVIYAAFLFSMVDRQHHEIMAFLILVLALLYALPAWTAARRGAAPVQLRDYLMTAIVLLIVATSIQFSFFVTIALWSCEAGVLVWSAVRWRYRDGAVAGLVFFAVITEQLVLNPTSYVYTPLAEFTAVLNWRCEAFLLLAASMAASARLLAGIEIRNRDRYVAVLRSIACFLLFVVITVETVDLFRDLMLGAEGTVRLAFMRNMTLLCVWTLAALALIGVGLRKDIRPALIAGCLLTAITFVSALVWGISFSPIEEFRLIGNVRMLALCFVLGGSLVSARWLGGARRNVPFAGAVFHGLLIGQVILFLFLLSGEVRDLFEQQISALRHLAGGAGGGEAARGVENMKQLSLSGLWLIYGIVLMTAGIWRHARGARLMALAILAIALLKIFVYDLSFLQTLYRIFSFIGLGLILLATSYMYQRHKTLIFGTGAAAEPGELPKGEA